MYCDKSLRKQGFPFECQKNYTQLVAVKSHKTVSGKFSRVILILRNPVNTILAYFNFERSGHTGTAPKSSYARSKTLVFLGMVDFKRILFDCLD